MILSEFLSPIDTFREFIAIQFRDLWHALIFVGRSTAVIVVLIGAIMVGISVKYNKVSGRHLILGGIILAIIIEFAIRFPPDFAMG
jgi:hypothetical protein